MTTLERIQIARAEEQVRHLRVTRDRERDPWDVRNAKRVPRVSMRGVSCPCGRPAVKKRLCHRCYMRVRSLA